MRDFHFGRCLLLLVIGALFQKMHQVAVFQLDYGHVIFVESDIPTNDASSSSLFQTPQFIGFNSLGITYKDASLCSWEEFVLPSMCISCTTKNPHVFQAWYSTCPDFLRCLKIQSCRWTAIDHICCSTNHFTLENSRQLSI